MGFINIHTHQYSANPGLFEIVNRYPWEAGHPGACYSMGIHPWYIEEGDVENNLQVIRDNIKDIKCLAIGECGLDKRIATPLPLQNRVFESQLEIAQQARLPVIVHCVAAYQEVIEIKKRMDITVPMIIHGFSKNTQVAESLLHNGFYLSFGKYLLRNPELSGVFRKVPDDRFFLETDTVEEGIAAVYEKAAAVKDISVAKLSQIVDGNFNFVFQK